MTFHPRARRLASALYLCALAGTALADGPAPMGGDAAQAGGAGEGAAARAERRPPPAVLVIPLGAALLLPLTLPTATPHARSGAGAPAEGAQVDQAGPTAAPEKTEGP